jgi:hypothetical protein
MTTRRQVNVGILSSVAAVAAAKTAFAQKPQAIDLPPPVMEGGKSLMQSLKDRQSTRDYSDRALPTQTLSNLLWAAWGVNRSQIDGRTAPRRRGVYALDVYLAMADGVWRYEPKSHQIAFHMAGDLRAQTTTGQPFVATAPLNLVYAFDTSKLTGTTEIEKIAAAAACVALGRRECLSLLFIRGTGDGFPRECARRSAGESFASSAAADHPVRADGRISEDLNPVRITSAAGPAYNAQIRFSLCRPRIVATRCRERIGQFRG